MEAPLRLRKGPGPTDSATAGALSSTRPASTLAAMDLGLSLTPAALGGEGAAAGAGFIPATNARNLRQTSKSNLWKSASARIDRSVDLKRTHVRVRQEAAPLATPRSQAFVTLQYTRYFVFKTTTRYDAATRRPDTMGHKHTLVTSITTYYG